MVVDFLDDNYEDEDDNNDDEDGNDGDADFDHYGGGRKN